MKTTLLLAVAAVAATTAVGLAAVWPRVNGL